MGKYRKPQTERRRTTREIETTRMLSPHEAHKNIKRKKAIDVTSQLGLRLIPTPPVGTRTTRGRTQMRVRDQTAGQSRKEMNWLTTRPKLTLDPQTSPSSSLPQANR